MINTTALKVIYLFVFMGFAMDAFLNSNLISLLLGGIGFGATVRDLFVILFERDIKHENK